MCFDGVNAVTVGADRGLPVAVCDRLSVNALRELLLNVVVTLGTSCRDVELEDGRLGVAGGENLVRSMAIRADGGFLRSSRDGSAMHAFLIRHERLRAATARGHHELLTVARAAGSGNVGVV